MTSFMMFLRRDAWERMLFMQTQIAAPFGTDRSSFWHGQQVFRYGRRALLYFLFYIRRGFYDLKWEASMQARIAVSDGMAETAPFPSVVSAPAAEA